MQIQWIPLNVGSLGLNLSAQIKRLLIKTEMSKKKIQKFSILKKCALHVTCIICNKLKILLNKIVHKLIHIK